MAYKTVNVFLQTSILVVKSTDDGNGTRTRSEFRSESEFEEIQNSDLDKLGETLKRVVTELRRKAGE